MLFLALLTGVGALLNYYAVTASIYSLLPATIIQFFLFVLTVIALIAYKGRRSRPSYDGGWYKIWTFSFALIVISFIGNFSILIVFILNLTGYLSGF